MNNETRRNIVFVSIAGSDTVPFESELQKFLLEEAVRRNWPPGYYVVGYIYKLDDSKVLFYKLQEHLVKIEGGQNFLFIFICSRNVPIDLRAFRIFKYHYSSIFVHDPRQTEGNPLGPGTGIVPSEFSEMLKERLKELKRKPQMNWGEIREFWTNLNKAMGKESKESVEDSDEKIWEEICEGFIEEEEKIKREHGKLAEKLLPSEGIIFPFYFQQDFATLLKYHSQLLNYKKKGLLIDDKWDTMESLLQTLVDKYPGFEFVCFKPEKQELIEMVKSGNILGYITELKKNLKESSEGSKELEKKIKYIKKREKLESEINNICITLSSSIWEENSTRPEEAGKEFDFILLDLYFAEQQWSGWEILEKLRIHHPHIPVFILSKSLEIDNVRKAMQWGADGYIPKHRLVALPFYIYRYFQEDVGAFLEKMQGNSQEKRKDYRQIFLGHLRLWHKQKDLLWMNTKTPHIVDHTYQHSQNLWKLLNQLSAVIGENNNLFKDPRLNFILASSIWLHDIGHKGFQEEIEAPIVRDIHSIISGKHITEQGQIYLPSLSEEKDELKKDIALVCAYHIKRMPLDEENEKKLKSMGNEPINEPILLKPELFPYLFPRITTEKVPYLSELCLNNNLLPPTALLRFLDAIDFQENRVGPPETTRERNYNCWFEANYYLKVLEKEVASLEEKLKPIIFLKEQGETLEKMKEFQEKIKRWLGKDGFLEQANGIIEEDMNKIEEYGKKLKELEEKKDGLIKKLQELFAKEFWRNWANLAEHILYLLRQPYHYLKHRTFQSVRIENSPDNKSCFRIVYTVRTPSESNKETQNEWLRQAFGVFEKIAEEHYLVEQQLKELPLESIVFARTSKEDLTKREEDWLILPFGCKSEGTVFYRLKLDEKNFPSISKKIQNIKETLKESAAQVNVYRYKDFEKIAERAVGDCWEEDLFLPEDEESYVVRWEGNAKEKKALNGRLGEAKKEETIAIIHLRDCPEMEDIKECDENILNRVLVEGKVENSEVKDIWLRFPIIEGGKDVLKTFIDNCLTQKSNFNSPYQFDTKFHKK